jgi:hypothetical protein
MGEVVITDSNDDGVLAEAAVASTAMSGAALAQSAAASQDAEKAEAQADHAVNLAVEAHNDLDNKPSFDEVSDMVETSVNDAFNRLADVLTQRMAPAAQEVMPKAEEVTIEEVPEEVAPRSVEKAKKTKKTFRERYLGLGDD